MATSIRPSTFSHALDTEMLESLSRSRINSLEQLATRPYSDYSLNILTWTLIRTCWLCRTSLAQTIVDLPNTTVESVWIVNSSCVTILYLQLGLLSTY